MARATLPTTSDWVLTDLPAKKAPPPLLTWMMTGDLLFLAASSTALHVEELREAQRNEVE
jgi:hypothetical protein